MNINQKLEKLIEIKIALMQEIYKQCIENNIDPDTFIYSDYINSSDESRIQGTLGAHCSKLDIIEKKIKELQ